MTKRRLSVLKSGKAPLPSPTIKTGSPSLSVHLLLFIHVEQSHSSLQQFVPLDYQPSPVAIPFDFCEAVSCADNVPDASSSAFLIWPGPITHEKPIEEAKGHARSAIAAIWEQSQALSFGDRCPRAAQLTT